MEIMNFETWNSIDEAKKTLTEAEGVSRAVYGALKTFFQEHGKEGSYEKAKSFVASKVEGWNLSKEDFEEAKKEMVKESLNEKEKEEKKTEKKKPEEEWKKKFDSFMGTEGGELKKKGTVFPEEISSLVSKFLQKHKDLEVSSGELVGYAKEILGM